MFSYSYEKGRWEEQMGSQKEQRPVRGRRAHGDQLRLEEQRGKGAAVQRTLSALRLCFLLLALYTWPPCHHNSASLQRTVCKALTVPPLSPILPPLLHPSLPPPAVYQNASSMFAFFIENLKTSLVYCNKIFDSCVWKRPEESSSINAHLPRTQEYLFSKYSFDNYCVLLILGAGNTPNKQKPCPHRAYVTVNISGHTACRCLQSDGFHE